MKLSKSVYLILLAGIISTSCEETISTRISHVNCESHLDCASPYPYCDTTSNVCMSCDQVTQGNTVTGESCVCNEECASGVCHEGKCDFECESSDDCNDKSKPFCEDNTCKNCDELTNKDLAVNNSCFCDTQCTTGICKDQKCALECESSSDCTLNAKPYCSNENKCVPCNEIPETERGKHIAISCICANQCASGICSEEASSEAETTKKCSAKCHDHKDCLGSEAGPWCNKTTGTCQSCDGVTSDDNLDIGDECFCGVQCVSGICKANEKSSQCVECDKNNNDYCRTKYTEEVTNYFCGWSYTCQIPFCNDPNAVKTKLEDQKITCSSIQIYSDQYTRPDVTNPDCIVFCNEYTLPADFDSISLQNVRQVIGLNESIRPGKAIITSSNAISKPLFTNVGSEDATIEIQNISLSYDFNNTDSTDSVRGILANDILNAEISNVEYTNTNAVIFNVSESETGGLIGSATNSSISNVNFDAELEFTIDNVSQNHFEYLGGIIGHVTQTDLTSLQVLQPLTITADLGSNVAISDIGGILGSANNDNPETSSNTNTIKEIHFNAAPLKITINGGNSVENVGGTIGSVQHYENLSNISFNDKMTINLGMSSDSIGGLIGYVKSTNSIQSLEINDSQIEMSVTNGKAKSLGGLIGQCNGSNITNATFKGEFSLSCANHCGDESCTNDFNCESIGGIIGQSSLSKFDQLYNYGNLKISNIYGDLSNVGGLVGHLYQDDTLINSGVISEEPEIHKSKRIEIISNLSKDKGKRIEAVGGLIGRYSGESLSDSSVEDVQIQINRHDGADDNKIYHKVHNVGGIVGVLSNANDPLINFNKLNINTLSIVLADHADYTQNTNSKYHTNIGGMIGTVNNVVLVDPLIKNLNIRAGKAAHVGGIIGYADNGTIWISKNQPLKNKEGLLVADLNYTQDGLNANRSSINIETINNTERDTAGVIGFISSQETHVYISHLNIVIDKIQNVLTDGAAGVIGWMGNNEESTLLIANLNHKANSLKADGENAAGIIGAIGLSDGNGAIKSVELYNISNYVNEISANKGVAGIAGRLKVNTKCQMINIQDYVTSIKSNTNSLASFVFELTNLNSMLSNNPITLKDLAKVNLASHTVNASDLYIYDQLISKLNTNNNPAESYPNNYITWNNSILLSRTYTALLDAQSNISELISSSFSTYYPNYDDNNSYFISQNRLYWTNNGVLKPSIFTQNEVSRDLLTYNSETQYMISEKAFEIPWGLTDTKLSFNGREITAPCFIDISEDIKCNKIP